jgi:hypothetical protein
MKFSYEQKRVEAVKALAELKRRLSNRRATGRHPTRMLQRIEIMTEIIIDYQRAIDREASRSLLGAHEGSDTKQYLLNLNSSRRLVPASGNDHDDGSD